MPAHSRRVSLPIAYRWIATCSKKGNQSLAWAKYSNTKVCADLPSSAIGSFLLQCCVQACLFFHIQYLTWSSIDVLLALQRLFVFRLLPSFSSASSSFLPLSSSTLDRHSSHHSHSFATRLAADSSPRQTCAPRLTEILRKQKTSGAVDNMKHFTGRVVALATFVASVHALNGIVAPANISADTKFEVTFENANSDQYRVYLAAALAGVNGPTCKFVAASPRFSCTKKSASPNKESHRLPHQLDFSQEPTQQPLHPRERRTISKLLFHRRRRPNHRPRRHLQQPLRPQRRDRKLLGIRKQARRLALLECRRPPLHRLRVRSRVRHGFVSGQFDREGCF